MRTTMRATLAMLAAAAVLCSQGCSIQTNGNARPAGTGITTNAGVGTTTDPGAGTTSNSCPGGTTIGDPWIAFESPLATGGRLTVGDRGWIEYANSLDDITVTGTKGAIELTLGSAVTEQRCGKVISSVSWVEVTGAKAGAVTITIAGEPASRVKLMVVGG